MKYLLSTWNEINNSNLFLEKFCMINFEEERLPLSKNCSMTFEVAAFSVQKIFYFNTLNALWYAQKIETATFNLLLLTQY